MIGGLLKQTQTRIAVTTPQAGTLQLYIKTSFTSWFMDPPDTRGFNLLGWFLVAIKSFYTLRRIATESVSSSSYTARTQLLISYESLDWPDYAAEFSDLMPQELRD